MRAWQKSSGKQEFVDDLPACEDKSALEKLHPRLFFARVVGVQPTFERTKLPFQLQDPLGIDDRRIDFEPVTDDARISQQAGTIRFSICSNGWDVKTIICTVKVIRFFQDRIPGKPRLVDLQDETFKKPVIALKWKSILGIMIDPVQCVLGVIENVPAIGFQSFISITGRWRG